MVFCPLTTLFADDTGLPAAPVQDQSLPAPIHFNPGTQTPGKIQLFKIEKKSLVQPLRTGCVLNRLKAGCRFKAFKQCSNGEKHRCTGNIVIIYRPQLPELGALLTLAVLPIETYPGMVKTPAGTLDGLTILFEQCRPPDSHFGLLLRTSYKCCD